MAKQELPDAPWIAKEPELEEAPWAAETRKVITEPGQAQRLEDEALVAKHRGAVSDATKAAGWAAANAFGLEAPDVAAAAYTSYMENKPFKEAFAEQKAYRNALERLNPTEAAAGTALGIGAGLFTPLGAVGTAAKAAKAATAAKFGETAGRMAEGAVIGGTLSGVSGGLRNLDIREGLQDAAMGAGLGAAFQPIIGSLSRYLTKAPKVVDEAGNLTAEAKSAVEKAFKGKISPEETNDFIASFQDKLVSKFKKEGISEAGARQALLESQGVKPTRSMVTGEPAPKVAEDITAAARQQAGETLAARAEEMAGRRPEEGALSEALHQKLLETKAERRVPFEKMTEVEGTFKPETFQTFMPKIDRLLSSDQKPTSAKDLADAGYTQAAKAYKFLEEGIAAGNLPLKDLQTGVDVANIANFEAVRRALNNFKGAAKGPDQAAMRRISDGFNEAYDDALKSQLFTGDGLRVYNQLVEARNGWTDFKRRFFGDKAAAGPQFKQAINSMADQATGMITDDIAVGGAKAADQILISGLLSPKMGEAMYGRLEQAFGAGSPQMQMVADQIKSKILRPDKGLSDIPKNVDAFLRDNRVVAEKVFNGVGGNPSIADLKRLSEAVRTINNSPLPQKEKDIRILAAMEKMVKWSISGAAGYLHGIPAGLATYIGSTGAEKAFGTAQGAIQRAGERAGAPATRPAVSLPLLPAGAELGSPVRTMSPFQESTEEPGYGPPLEVRPGRANGGRISDRLVRAADVAKNAITTETKPLLDTHDNHVAAALEVANRAVEG